MKRRGTVFILGFFLIFHYGTSFSEEIIYPHIQYPPSHHVVTPGEVVTAHLLLPIDCGLAQSGEIIAQTEDPIYNTIPGWEGEVIIPAGTRITGSYLCYPRSVYLSFNKFIFRTPQSDPLYCRYSAPHNCVKILEGNTGDRLRVRIDFRVQLMTVHSVWVPDSH